MRRLWMVLAALALVAVACGDDTSVLTPQSTEAATTTEGIPTTEAPPVSTTTAPPTTSTDTTTAPPAQVTIDVSLPGGVMGRQLIPWSEVGGDWVLALYSGDRVHGGFVDGPTALYLASPEGDVYEITAWGAGSGEPDAVLDWSPDGERALLRVLPDPPSADEPRLVLVDLVAGTRSDLLAFDESVWSIDAGFAEAGGKNVVFATEADANQHLEVHRFDGANTVFVDHPALPVRLRWLYGQAGTTVVVSDIDGLGLFDDQGNAIRGLDTPGYECLVPRWRENMVLAACVPYEERALDNYYHQLSLVPVDGSESIPLTTVPEDVSPVDYGFVDARDVGGETVLQWTGDCATGSLQILQPDGSGVPIPTELPVVAEGIDMVTPQGSLIAVRYWDDCGPTEIRLGQIDLDGTFLGDLIPVVDDRAGIVSAVGRD